MALNDQLITADRIIVIKNQTSNVSQKQTIYRKSAIALKKLKKKNAHQNPSSK